MILISNSNVSRMGNVSGVSRSNMLNSKVSNIAETSQIYLTDIKNRIKNKLSSNLRTYIIIMIPVIILLCYFIYNFHKLCCV